MARPQSGAAARRGVGRGAAPVYAALDLGTNNCRLLVAAPTRTGFRVIDGYSQIVRLGEGLAASGRLGAAPMARAREALTRCAERLAHHARLTVRCVATQACRAAANGAEFLDMVQRDTGLAFETISPAQEAALGALGCAGLVDPCAEVSVVVDVGGGSTEFTWLATNAARGALRNGRIEAAILSWTSIPMGVVTLAEAAADAQDPAHWRPEAVAAVRAAILAAPEAARMVGLFQSGAAQLIGASGAVTSLAGVHLDLPRYSRARVDGVWLTAAELGAAVERVYGMGQAARVAHPCIGPDRADLVAAGAAIMEAVVSIWPFERVRVADRGLREGMLIKMIAEARGA